MSEDDKTQRAWVRLISDGTRLDLTRDIPASDKVNAYGVFGGWDVIVKITHCNVKEINDIVFNLRSLPGVYRSNTTKVAIESIKPDSMFRDKSKFHAFTLINTRPGKEGDVQKLFEVMPEVLVADIIYGDFDMIVESMTSSPPFLRMKLMEVRGKGDITKTHTLVAFS